MNNPTIDGVSPEQHEERRKLRDLMVGYLPMAQLIPLAKAIQEAGFVTTAPVVERQAAEIAGLKADADRYRKLQKLSPYRFKKMQDASTTDGGDVFYFHRDRFDAYLDATQRYKS